MDELLEKYCRQLHFGSNLVDNAKRIKGKDNIEFLIELFRLELENRELKRKNMYIKQARSTFSRLLRIILLMVLTYL